MENLLEKHPNLQFLWLKLKDKFGPDYFALVDFWEADLLATGFRRGDKLVYVSIWDEDKKDAHPGRFYCVGEMLDAESLETLQIVFEKKGLDMEELLSEILHFIKG